MTQHQPQPQQFYLTAPTECPYLDNRAERKVFTHLVGNRAPELNDLLTQAGFRRSQNIAYRPACENCNACVSVRILAGEFKMTRSMRRIWKRNQDLIGFANTAEPSSEQYALFHDYLNSRHHNGGMSEMSVLDYAMMVEDSHVNTQIIEYRIRGADTMITGKGEGPLIAAALTDVMGDGVSMVYSFFNPELADRSIGTYIILDHIMRCNALGLPHVYLGYWVNGSAKMHYKTRYKPQEHLTANGWQLTDIAD